MLAHELLEQHVRKSIVPYCSVIAQPTRSLGTTIRLGPNQPVPEDSADIFIQIHMDDIPASAYAREFFTEVPTDEWQFAEEEAHPNADVEPAPAPKPKPKKK